MIMLDMHNIDLSIPLVTFQGDALQVFSLAKEIIQGEHVGGGLADGDRLFAPIGVPERSEWFSIFSLILSPLSQLIIKLISLFTNDVIQVVNIYYLLTYYFGVLSFVYVAKYFKIPTTIAVSFGILYTLLPFHFMRGISHLWVASYFLVPIFSLIVIWIWSQEPIFFKLNENNYKFSLFNKKSSIAILFLFFLTEGNHYYLFFFIFFAAISGLIASIYRKSIVNLVSALLVILLAGFSIYKANIPDSISRFYHETIEQEVKLIQNNQPISGYGEAEHYGLKITQLLLPIDNHRFDYFGQATRGYNQAHHVTENKTATLGLIASIGFLILLVILVLPKSYLASDLTIIQKLSALNIFAILLATIGGFSSLIPTILLGVTSPDFPLIQARSYNRISVYIAFFSLLTLTILINKYGQIWWENYIKKHNYYFCKLNWKFSSIFVATPLLIFGLLDQVSPSYSFITAKEHKSQYLSDKQFFQKIENMNTKGAMIFQLPFVIHHRGSIKNYYDSNHLRGHSLSNTLKWSFGGDEGTFQTFIYHYLASLSVEELVKKLSILGFAGIYIDTEGYSDNAFYLKEQLSHTLNQTSIISNNNKLLYFSLLKSSNDTLKNDLLDKLYSLYTNNVRLFSFTSNMFGVISGVGIRQSDKVISTGEKAGFLIYGPYTKASRGKYKINVFGTFDYAENNKIGYIDVVSNSGTNLIAKKDLLRESMMQSKDDSLLISLEFQLNNDVSNLEFRINVNKGVKLSLNRLELVRQ
jgi:phosphoglycerol transferase